MTLEARPATGPGAALPDPRGPLSGAVLHALRHSPAGRAFDGLAAAEADPVGDDLQLALYLCYELHYQGLRGVDPEWEWNPELLRLRATMETRFLDGVRLLVPGGDDLDRELDALLTEHADARSLSHFLRDEGEWWQLREFFAHRSLYHLKEADPHAWVIPRLRGRAKAALVAVEFDEFGGGRAEHVHATLFANLLAEAGLSTRYLHYLDQVPGTTLATVNLMSLFGLHRRYRAALVGHFAAAEITTGPTAHRLDAALRRLGGGAECRHFYTEHVEADAVHEQVLRTEVLGGLLEDEPELLPDVVFGIQATGVLDDMMGDQIMAAWQAGCSSLRLPPADG